MSSPSVRELIDKIEVFTDGHRKLYDSKDRDGDDFREYMDAVLDHSYPGRIPKARKREHNQFIEHVLKRRMSKDGRFLRLYFKGGARMDVVPGNSIASGMALGQIGLRTNGHRFMSPNIHDLTRKFQRIRKPK